MVITFSYLIYLVLFGALYAMYLWLSERRRKSFLIAAGLGVVFATFVGTPPSIFLLIGLAAALISVIVFARWRASIG